jgi:hypothetical protein
LRPSVADLLATAGANRVDDDAAPAQVHGSSACPSITSTLKVLAKHFRRHSLKDTVIVSRPRQREAGLPFRPHAEAAGGGWQQARLSDDRVVLDAIVGDA